MVEALPHGPISVWPSMYWRTAAVAVVPAAVTASHHIRKPSMAATIGA